jgi:hypothetical protein
MHSFNMVVGDDSASYTVFQVHVESLTYVAYLHGSFYWLKTT